MNNPLSVVDPSGHFFGIVFAIVSVISYIVGAVFTAIAVLVAVVMKAIAAIVLAAKVLITEAVKFTIGVVKTSFGWMKSVGSKLITSVKAGWSQGISSMMAVKGKTVALGAATNAAWSGIQTARHGGSWKDIFRSAVKGAVIGAIGAVTGAFMNGFGAGVGSFAGGGGSLTGTVMHAAAHGVSAGSLTAANGGSFKDGFIGGAIGFGVGLPFRGAGGAIQGTAPGAIAARTAIAAVGGGVGSKLTGGSFADGAYSAAFNHLFNSEVEAVFDDSVTGPVSEWTKVGEYSAGGASGDVLLGPLEPSTPPGSGGGMGGFGSILGLASMIPGPIGTVAGVLEVGVALLHGDWAGAGWAVLGAGAALVGAGAAVKGFRAFRAAKMIGASSRFVPIQGRQLQKVFSKHGDDFGFSGNWNQSRAAEVSASINKHINAPGVQQIAGTYRGNPVTHFVDPRSGLNVFLDSAGNFGGGWKLGADQLKGVLSGGRLY